MTRSLLRSTTSCLVAASALLIACEADLVIGPEGIDSVTVDQTVVALLVGEGIQLNAATRDENGVAFSGPVVTWVSSNLAVARVSSTGLVAAVGIGTATITAAVDGFTASASLLVTAAPAIALSSNTVSFNAVEGGANPVAQTIGISNDGGGAITALGTGAVVYNSGEPTGWLTAAIAPGLDSLTIRAAAGSLAPATYQARIPLLSDDAANSPLNVFVTFTVNTAVPTIQLSDTFVSFSAFGGGANPSSQSVTVSNVGTGSFAGLAAGPIAYAPNQSTGWLSANLVSGTITLQATTGSLLAGNYLATVPVTATNADNNPQLIVVGFSVSPSGPAIGAMRTTLSFNGAENGPNPPPDTVGIVNLGSGVLDQMTVGTVVYGNGQPTGWLSGTLTSTTAPASLVITTATAGLPAGGYSATLPIESPVATNSPVLINVSFVLSGSDSIRFDPASGQLAVVSTAVSPAPILIVVDALGNPVSGREVFFSTSGSGAISQPVDTTGASGLASVAWTLGTVAGTDTDTLTASLPGGLSTTWIASATPGMVTQLIVATQPSGAVSQTVFTGQPAVRVTDQFGNPVGQSGLSVDVASSMGAGTLGGTLTAITDANGLATFAGLIVTDTDSLTALGPHQLAFTANNLTMASSSVFNVDVSFTRNVQLVIQTAEGAAFGDCTGCHPGYTSRSNLVGALTSFNGGCGILVVASDTASSILYQKVIANGNWCGNGRMPQGDTLSTARQNVIRDWILQGANQN